MTIGGVSEDDVKFASIFTNSAQELYTFLLQAVGILDEITERMTNTNMAFDECLGDCMNGKVGSRATEK